MVRHGGDAGVARNVHRGFDHVDDGVDREDHTHQVNRDVEGRHEGEGEEVAAHRNTGVADSGDHGDDHPDCHRTARNRDAGILHQVEGRDQNERSAAIHVDRGADREHEAGNAAVKAQVLFSRGKCHRKRTGGALREESNSKRREHALQDAQRIDPAGEKEERQHNEELQQVTRHHNGDILAEGTNDHTGFNLGGQLACKGKNTDRENEEKCADQREKEFLESEDHPEQGITAFRAGHEGESQADGNSDHQNGKHIAFKEGVQNVVRNDRQEVVVVAEGLKILRNGSGTGG